MFNRSGVQNIYNHKVRIGNWSEDQELEELRMKEYLHKKTNGKLLVHTVQKHLGASLQPVGLTYSKDGNIHFGDNVMLYSVETGGVLSSDPSDHPFEGAYSATTSTLTRAHVARNTFVIEPYNNQGKNGDALKLGQLFRFRINPRMSDNNDKRAYYLHSQPISTTFASKVSRKQLVSFTRSTGYDTVWRCAWKDITKRFEMEGQAVPANAEIILIHVQTQHALASAKNLYYNDFGQEFEVYCHSHLNIAKKQSLYAELQGKATSDISQRPEHPHNHFAFLTAVHPDMESLLDNNNNNENNINNNDLTPEQKTQRVVNAIATIREKIFNTLGLPGLLNLSRSLRLSDTTDNESLPIETFTKIIKDELSLNLNSEDLKELLQVLDTRKDKSVDYFEFLKQIRGEFPDSRLRLVERAFDSVDTKKAGIVHIKDIKAKYDASAHPGVKAGKLSADTVINEFLSGLSLFADGNGNVRVEDFREYYANVSPFVETDEYFTHLIGTAFGLDI